jgi:putative flippase GtrA
LNIINIVRKTVEQLIKRYETFIKYSLIGVTGATLDFIIFAILVKYSHLYYQYANIISVSIGITNNYLLNAYYNFKLKDKMLLRFIKFYSVGIIGLLLSSALLYVLVNIMFINKMYAKLLTIIVTTLVQYFLNKQFTFRKSYCDEEL